MSKFQVLQLRYKDLKRRLKNLWNLSNYDWTPQKAGPPPKHLPREAAIIIDTTDYLKNTYEAIRKENSSET